LKNFSLPYSVGRKRLFLGLQEGGFVRGCNPKCAACAFANEIHLCGGVFYFLRGILSDSVTSPCPLCSVTPEFNVSTSVEVCAVVKA
jgi:hypothetical protein